MTATPIVALDVSDVAAATRIIDTLGDRCTFYKIGSELFTAAGPAVVDAVRGRGKDVFLDLKFHDIPNTVRGAVRAAASLGVRLLTVHASGGRAMLSAAADAVRDSRAEGGGCRILAVSVLTSLNAQGLAEAWGRTDILVESEVVRLATLAKGAGIDGLVCSAHEARAVRRAIGPDFELLVPGIRLGGAPGDDQARIATAAEAAAAGATYIILGRTVTAASDPGAAMAAVLRELGAVPAA